MGRPAQARAAVGDNQGELLAFQSTPVEIAEQSFPIGLALALAAQKGQQVTRAVAPHSVGHPLGPRRTPHPQAHSV